MATYIGSPPRSVALVQFAAGSRGGPRRGLCEWGGGRCDDGAGGAGFGHGQTTPWDNLTIADKMARADLLLRGGQSTKNASDTAAGAGGRSTAPAGVAHTGQGGLRGRETALPPAGGGVAPALGQHHPRGTRSCDKRRPEHSVGGAAGWWASRALTHTRRAAASPDRGDARAGEVPEGVRGAPSGGRPAAVTPHAALSRSEGDSRQPPCGDVVSSRAPPAAAAETYVPCGQPARCTCRSDPPRPAHSASTPRGPPRYSGGRRGYPASGAGGGRDRATRRRSRGRSKSFLRVGGRRGAATAWLCPP